MAPPGVCQMMKIYQSCATPAAMRGGGQGHTCPLTREQITITFKINNLDDTLFLYQMDSPISVFWMWHIQSSLPLHIACPCPSTGSGGGREARPSTFWHY